MRRCQPSISSLMVITAALAALALVPRGVSGQSREATIQRVEKAISNADVSNLVAAMAPRVAIGVFGATREYSRGQAEYVMKDFFTRHPPTSFALRKDSATEQGTFLGGRYRSASLEGEADLYVRLRERDGQWEVREIMVRSAPG